MGWKKVSGPDEPSEYMGVCDICERADTDIEGGWCEEAGYGRKTVVLCPSCLAERKEDEKLSSEDVILGLKDEVERLREQLHEHRATIFAKEAEAQKWANECERLRAAIKSEAEQHDIDGRDGMPRAYPCDCQICMIAREGR